MRVLDSGERSDVAFDIGRHDTDRGESSDEISSLLHRRSPGDFALRANNIGGCGGCARRATASMPSPPRHGHHIEQRPPGDAAQRPDPGGRDVLPVALRDRRARALRLPFFYDFMVRDFGWSRAQVTSGNAISKLVVGPLFGFAAGWFVDRVGPRRLMIVGILMAGIALVGLGSITHAGGLLLLLSVQRARERARRSAAESGAALALVQRGARPSDGVRLSRHRARRRAGAADRLPLSQAFGWHAALKALGVAHRHRRAAARARREGIAAGLERRRRRAPRGRRSRRSATCCGGRRSIC